MGVHKQENRQREVLFKCSTMSNGIRIHACSAGNYPGKCMLCGNELI